MKEETYEVMEELVKANEIRKYLTENYHRYDWMDDIMDIVCGKIMDLEDFIIMDIKNAK